MSNRARVWQEWPPSVPVLDRRRLVPAERDDENLAGIGTVRANQILPRPVTVADEQIGRSGQD